MLYDTYCAETNLQVSLALTETENALFHIHIKTNFHLQSNILSSLVNMSVSQILFSYSNIQK